MSSWVTTSKTNVNVLEKVQNAGLRIITGAMKSTPIADMERVTGLFFINERREIKVLNQSEKLKRPKTHPPSSLISQPTKYRLKRKSFNHIARSLSHQQEPQSLNLPQEREPLENTSSLHNPLADLQISLEIPGIQRKADLQPGVLKALTEDFIDR